MTTEFRATNAPVQLRSNDGIGRLGGYALRFNKLSRNLGGFVERVAPGAVAKSLGDKLDVVCRFQHRDDYLLGRVESGTLVLRSDAEGLDYTVDLPDTTVGRDVAALAARGDLRHSSFAFELARNGDDWSLTDDNFPVRTLTAIQLRDVSPVVNPAYPDATSGLRSLAERAEADIEEIRALAEANDLRRLFSPHTRALHIDLAARAFPPKDKAKPEDDKDAEKPAPGADEKPPVDEDGKPLPQDENDPEAPEAPPAAVVEDDPAREPKSPTKKPEDPDEGDPTNPKVDGRTAFTKEVDDPKAQDDPETSADADSEDDDPKPEQDPKATPEEDDEEEKKQARREIERMRLELRAKRWN